MSKETTAGLSASIAAIALLVCCGVTVVLPILGGASAVAACEPRLAAPTPGPPPGEWNAAQLAHAATIVAVGKQRGVPPRGWVIAVATAMQESALRNLANSAVPRSMNLTHDAVGSDHDSVGLFQQRVSPPDGLGRWGTPEQLMTPAIAAEKFYTALLAVRGWQQMRLTDAAQAVQHSAFPEAYQQRERATEQVVAAIAGVGDIGQIGGGPPNAPCGVAGLPTGIVGPRGWIQPVRAPIGDGFGASRPGGRRHAGVDLIAKRGTPIRAAAAGTVTKVRCQSSTGTCDRDGSPQATGCGWYAEVTHPIRVTYNGIAVTTAATRYCHMGSLPGVHVGQRVEAGTVLGFVGSSGGSSGPHLHWEIHLNSRESINPNNAIDPEHWMAFVRAPLGQ